MVQSRHYINDRQEREKAIQRIGLGVVVHEEIHYCEKRDRSYRYQITDHAILVIVAVDDPNFMINRYPARPSRINKYWTNSPVPKEILEISIKNTRMGLTF